MYNRYIPQNEAPLEEAAAPQEPIHTPHSGGIFSTLSSLFPALSGNGGAKNAGGLSGIFERLGLGKSDHGDILLLLILIYLFRESDDDEWLIILALVLLMGL